MSTGDSDAIGMWPPMLWPPCFSSARSVLQHPHTHCVLAAGWHLKSCCARMSNLIYGGKSAVTPRVAARRKYKLPGNAMWLGTPGGVRHEAAAAVAAQLPPLVRRALQLCPQRVLDGRCLQAMRRDNSASVPVDSFLVHFSDVLCPYRIECEFKGASGATRVHSFAQAFPLWSVNSAWGRTSRAFLAVDLPCQTRRPQ